MGFPEPNPGKNLVKAKIGIYFSFSVWYHVFGEEWEFLKNIQ